MIQANLTQNNTKLLWRPSSVHMAMNFSCSQLVRYMDVMKILCYSGTICLYLGIDRPGTWKIVFFPKFLGFFNFHFPFSFPKILKKPEICPNLFKTSERNPIFMPSFNRQSKRKAKMMMMTRISI